MVLIRRTLALGCETSWPRFLLGCLADLVAWCVTKLGCLGCVYVGGDSGRCGSGSCIVMYY